MKLGKSIIIKITAIFVVAVATVQLGNVFSSGDQAHAVATTTGFEWWDEAREFNHGVFSGGAVLANYQNKAMVTLRSGTQQGAWESPAIPISSSIGAINPSWQATTPIGSHVTIQLKVKDRNNQWSDWYNMGEWTFKNTANNLRTSVNGQSDDFGGVYTDTFIAFKSLSAYRVKVQLHASSSGQKPKVYQIAAQSAAWKEFTQVSRTTMTQTVDLDVPQYSQYDHTGEFPQYGGGGEAWCSPTSVAMVMEYYGKGPLATDIANLPSDPVFDANGRDDGEVTHAALHTYDDAYGGTGNWPFNTAYAAHYGLDSAVRVFGSLRDIERRIKNGEPVVVSINWNNEDDNPNNDLPGAGIPSTGGHLMVVRGFTASGDVIANDPATHNGDNDVRRVYDRAAFERQWITASNGTTYVFSD